MSKNKLSEHWSDYAENEEDGLTIMNLRNKLDCAVKALEEIKYMDRIHISCPDNRKSSAVAHYTFGEGCAVAHYTLGEYGNRAQLALEEIKHRL